MSYGSPDPALVFALDAADRMVLHRAGVTPVPSGDVVWSVEEVNEAVYLLDRAAEHGDGEAADLATYLLLAGEVYNPLTFDPCLVE